MKVMLLGMREVDFQDKQTGKQVKGTKLFYAYPEEGVQGQVCESKFISNLDLFEIDPKDYLGAEIHLETNTSGKVIGVTE